MTKISKVYKVEDIFKPIPGDDENELLVFPPEILEQVGWKEGTPLNITVDEKTKTMTIKRVDK